MSTDEYYELVVTPPAARAISQQLPEPVAAAVIEFLTSTLIREPRRVGKQLRRELAGIWSARRGTYRVLYRINEERQEVIVLRIAASQRRVPATVTDTRTPLPNRPASIVARASRPRRRLPRVARKVCLGSRLVEVERGVNCLGQVRLLVL